MTGEERERKMLDDQIARAKAEADAAGGEVIPAELQKKEGEKFSFSLFGATTPALPPASTDGETSTTPVEAGPSKPAPNTSLSFGSLASTAPPVTIANPLKRPAPVNVFKSAKVPKSDSTTNSSFTNVKQKQLSEVERLMQEDQARKANRGGRGGYQGQGPRRG